MIAKGILEMLPVSVVLTPNRRTIYCSQLTIAYSRTQQSCAADAGVSLKTLQYYLANRFAAFDAAMGALQVFGIDRSIVFAQRGFYSSGINESG